MKLHKHEAKCGLYLCMQVINKEPELNNGKSCNPGNHNGVTNGYLGVTSMTFEVKKKIKVGGLGLRLVTGGFREFIERMEMEEIRFQEMRWTWVNNWEGEDYIEVRLYRFCGSGPWLLDHANAGVRHIERQTSYHSLMILDT